MGVTFFMNEGLSLYESLERHYAGFREYTLNAEDHTPFVNAPHMQEAYDEVLEFMLENEKLPSINEMDSELLNQMVSTLFSTYLQLIIDKKPLRYFGGIIRKDRYEEELKLIHDDEVLYLWNFLLYGRCTADSHSFFHLIASGYKLGYWTEPERVMLLERLEKIYRRGSFNVLPLVLDVLKETNHEKGNLLFSIG